MRALPSAPALPRGPLPTHLVMGLLGIGMAVYLAVAVTSERYREVLLTAAALQTAWITVRWRASVYIFVVFVALEGFMINFFYTVPELNLLKDLLTVVLFAVLAVALVLRSPASIFPKTLWMIPFLAFAGIYLLHVFNPILPNILVGLVGVRVNLLFALLAPVGYWFSDSRDRVFHFFEFLLWLSIPVSLFGILQSWLGSAWVVSLSPGFEKAVYLAVGAGGHRSATSYFRTFSTFVHTGGFALFLSLTLLITIALWLLPAWRNRKMLLGGAFAIQFWAFLTTGGRGAFLVFMISIVILLLSNSASRRLLPLVLVIPLVFFGSSIFWAGGIQDRYETLLDFDYLVERNAPLVGGWLGQAMKTDWAGSGAGYASVASRHVGYTPLNHHTVENGLAKIRFEAGLPGMIFYTVFILGVLMECVAILPRIKDPELRWIITVPSLFVFWNVILVIMGCPFDVSPTNTLIWFFLGMMARAPLLEVRQPCPAC